MGRHRARLRQDRSAPADPRRRPAAPHRARTPDRQPRRRHHHRRHRAPAYQPGARRPHLPPALQHGWRLPGLLQFLGPLPARRPAALRPHAALDAGVDRWPAGARRRPAAPPYRACRRLAPAHARRRRLADHRAAPPHLGQRPVLDRALRRTRHRPDAPLRRRRRTQADRATPRDALVRPARNLRRIPPPRRRRDPRHRRVLAARCRRRRRARADGAARLAGRCVRPDRQRSLWLHRNRRDLQPPRRQLHRQARQQRPSDPWRRRRDPRCRGPRPSRRRRRRGLGPHTAHAGMRDRRQHPPAPPRRRWLRRHRRRRPHRYRWVPLPQGPLAKISAPPDSHAAPDRLRCPHRRQT